MKTKFICIIIALTVFISSAQTIEKFSIDSGGASETAGGIQILYTIGEVNVQEYSTATLSVSEGFINPMSLMIKLDTKIFLEGSYTPGNMTDALRNNHFIPTTSPYADGAVCNAAIFDTTGSNAIIDWVWIEIRDSVDNTLVVTQTSALLQADGDVVATDGVSAVPVNAQAGTYYLMLSHRNHLGILTANTVNLSGGSTSIDLTSDSSLITGGTNGIANMGDGRYALFAGDFNGNGQVQNSDGTGVVPFLGLSGYYNADINMNGQVQNGDILNSIIPNLGKGQQFVNRKLFAKRRTIPVKEQSTTYNNHKTLKP